MRRILTLSALAALASLALVWGGVAHEQVPAVDGIVSDGEYANHYTNKDLNMKVHWTVDTEESVIYIALEAPTKGWVGIGFDFKAPDKKSMSMDWIIGAFHDKDGETDTLDAFQARSGEPAQADTFLGGKDDITEKAAVQTEKETTFEFARPLDTGDKFDVTLKPGAQGTMLAFGDEDEYKHFHQESLTMVMIDFFTGKVGKGE